MIKKKKIKLNYLIKWMPFPFILIACPIWIAIYRLRYFMLQPFGNFKYCRDNNWFNKYVTHVSFFLIWMKKQGSEYVFVSFHYWEKSLGNTLKYFLSLRILLMNLLSPSLSNQVTYVYVYEYFYVNIYVYMCIICV